NEYLHKYGPVNILLHTLAGKGNSVYVKDASELNHFNKLSLTPGELTSPIITYEHIRNYSKSRSLSTSGQYSGGNNSGFGAFSGYSKPTSSKTYATITKDISVTTTSDVTGVNSD